MNWIGIDFAHFLGKIITIYGQRCSNVLCQGTCKFKINDFIVSLNDVLYVFNIRRDLLSVHVLNKKC